MILQGTLNNGTIVLDEPVSLPDGARLEVDIKPISEKKPTLSERLLKHAGTVTDLVPDNHEKRRGRMSLEGTVVNGVIVLGEEEKLPEGTRVEIIVEETPKAASPLGEALMKLAGTAVGLPEDMAAQHDHYLHGTPKR